MRITISLSDEMLKKVDEQARKLGTSRGAMLTTWIGEKINSLQTTEQLFQNMFNDDLFKDLMIKELSKQNVIKGVKKIDKK